MEKQQQITPRRQFQVSGKTAVLTSAAGLMIGGPLLGLMGISFAATVALLVVSFPLFVIFSPVLFGAALVFGLVMIGFAAAGAMAVAGVSAVAWVLRPSRSGRSSAGKLMEGGGDVEGKDWAGHVQKKPFHSRENVIIDRA